jgi:hypothetical protein
VADYDWFDPIYREPKERPYTIGDRYMDHAGASMGEFPSTLQSQHDDDRGKLQQSHPASAPQEGFIEPWKRPDFVPPKKDSDPVNHPDHYGGKDNIYEARKVIRAWKLGFNLGNVVKYISRAGKKDPAKHIEDLEKALFYLRDEIEALKAEQVDN